MHKIIRNGAFETNSSSVHTLVMQKDGIEIRRNNIKALREKYKRNALQIEIYWHGEYYLLPSLEQKQGDLHRDIPIVEIKGGEFGWGPDQASSFEERLSYLVVLKNMEQRTGWFNPEKTQEVLDFFDDFLWRTARMRCVIDKEHYYESYIDHQSVDWPIVDFTDEEALSEILYSDCFIEIDHDNH